MKDIVKLSEEIIIKYTALYFNISPACVRYNIKKLNED